MAGYRGAAAGSSFARGVTVELLLIVLLVLLLLGGIPAYGNRADWGSAPAGIVGLLLTIVLIVLLLRLLGVWV